MNGCTDEMTGRMMLPYELDQLPEEDRRRFEDHLLDCDHCFGEITQMMPTMMTLRRHKQPILAGLEVQEFARQGVGSERSLYARESDFWRSLRKLFEGWLRPKTLLPAAGLLAALALLIFIARPAANRNPYLPYLSFERPLYWQGTRGPAQPASEAQRWFNVGINRYGEGDLQGAIEPLQQAVSAAPDSGTWWLFLGVSQFLLKQGDEAIASLTAAQRLSTGRVLEMASYYLAQSYLLTGDPKAAAPLLQSVKDTGGEHRAHADSLLTKIRAISSQ